MKESSFQDQILRKLDVLISLHLDLASGEPVPINAKVRRLSELGMQPAEIGRVIDRSASYVSAMLGSRRRKGTERR